jgi:4-hydroxybutyryl-CoA dehydratase / vinylacetyl-CoA-Delta-isomerase
MALKTPAEYIQSIADLDLEIYMFGERVNDYTNHPIIRPSLTSVATTYEFAGMPEYQDLMTATSHISGEKISRFTHIHQSTEDLLKKIKMQRLLGQRTATCVQRCVGMDAINSVFSVSYEIDKAKGTD